jgi:transposase
VNYIGIDCHITTLDFAVVNETGRLVKEERVGTSKENLITFIKGVKPPRVVYIEEGTLAGWILETCSRYGEKLVITNPKENRWIGTSGQKNDKLDALKIARLARGGYIKEVYHPIGQRRRFKELMLAYHDTVRSGTRIKNKIKAKFRGNGIPCTGETIYKKRYREEWRKKLPDDPGLLMIIDNLWLQMDRFEEAEVKILAEAKKQARQYPEIKRFQAIPGVGFITAATISAILETPWRFANKRKVWMYAGLGIVRRGSGEKVYSEKLTKDYNRLLKYVIKQAVQAAIQAEDNPFRRKYLEMTLIRGVAPHRARLTIARDMLAVMLAMWRKGEEYRPELRETHLTKQSWT